MKNFNILNSEIAQNIKFVLCDIDDTITSEGKLSAKAYAALWQLSENNIQVIPVTGRPAGWCDMIIRQWPVKAVVGENGAFVFYFENGQLKKYTHPSVATGDIQGKLNDVKMACLNKVPGCRVSKDQFARIYDVAIDFNEDEPRLGFEAAEKIKAVCEEMGAVAKVSSIHVNTWFGEYNKVDMTRLFFNDILKIDEDALKKHAIFFGDSPNDEPMFKFFTYSTAVANIKPFVSSLTHLPTFITDECSGEGFAKAIEHLLEMKNL